MVDYDVMVFMRIKENDYINLMLPKDYDILHRSPNKAIVIMPKSNYSSIRETAINGGCQIPKHQ